MSLFVQFGTILFGVLSLILIVPPANGFSYENLPAVAMDYKVHVDAGKEDCYFQYVNPGATFYVSFQVSSVWMSFNGELWWTVLDDEKLDWMRIGLSIGMRLAWLTIWLREVGNNFNSKNFYSKYLPLYNSERSILTSILL